MQQCFKKVQLLTTALLRKNHLIVHFLCFSKQGSAKVNNRAKKLTKEFTNYAAYMAVYKKGGTKNFSSALARKEACAYNSRYANGDSFKKVSKRLFGRSTPYIAANIGEWGVDYPYLSSIKMFIISLLCVVQVHILSSILPYKKLFHNNLLSNNSIIIWI